MIQMNQNEYRYWQMKNSKPKQTYKKRSHQIKDVCQNLTMNLQQIKTGRNNNNNHNQNNTALEYNQTSWMIKLKKRSKKSVLDQNYQIILNHSDNKFNKLQQMKIKMSRTDISNLQERLSDKYKIDQMMNKSVSLEI